MQNNNQRKTKIHSSANATMSLLLLLITACTSNDITKQSVAHRIVSANAAVSQSIVNDARIYAPIELRTAERKLEDARTLAGQENYLMAHLLAQQVEIDAQFAEAKAQSKKAEKLVELLLENNRILENEISRASTP